MALSLGSLVDTLGGTLVGDAAQLVAGFAPLESAGPDQLSFLSSVRYADQLPRSRAGCVIVGSAMREAASLRGACIVADDPYLYFARATQLWRRLHTGPQSQGVHPTAVVDPLATVASDAVIGPLCVVERGASIGSGTVLKSRVTVAEACSIGQRCILHPGVVVGADGFGFANHAGRWEKIEQLGAVRIGDDVEIGANTCIDRGAMADTVIEDGVKLDNLIQIGHNVHVGRHTAMAACVGIAGSAHIGAYCTIGGAAVVLGHLRVADHVDISAASVVTRSILRAGQYTGIFPIDDNANWEKNAAVVKRLHALRSRLVALERPPLKQTLP